MSNYELVFIINPEVADEDITGIVNKVTELVNGIGGSVAEIDEWGRKKMAYPIKRFLEGNYVLAKLELEPVAAKKMETNFRFPDEILRHLLIRLKD